MILEDPFHSSPRRCSTGRHVLHRMGRYRRGRSGIFLLFGLLISCFYILSTVFPEGISNQRLIRSALSSAFKSGTLISSQSSTSEIDSIAKSPKSARNESRFHLLVPATESNGNLCKTLLSAFALDYPPPTLINFNKSFDKGGWDNGSHTGKIRGVFEFLSDQEQVRDDDMVLVIDGYDVWLQLPPQILLDRFRALVKKSNKSLLRQYGRRQATETGTTIGGTNGGYNLSIIFAADKLCWPNSYDDPACSSVPESTLPADAWGPTTDQDPAAYLNRPKYLNSGTIIGRAAGLRKLYKQAVHKVEVEGRGEIGDQFVFSEIFGEQELSREQLRQSQKGAAARFRDWVSGHLGLQARSTLDEYIHSNATGSDISREYGIGLDYESSLFQTLTHSHGDMEFLKYSNTTTLSEAERKHKVKLHKHLKLPKDLQSLPGPFHLQSFANTSIVPLSPELDILPATNRTWADSYLATNLHVPTVPVALHFNGDKEYLTTWWPKLWYQPWARALLRRYIRTPPASDPGDSRGGKGGIWTAGKVYLAWKDICKGYEDEVFGDGKGSWGEENGGFHMYNTFGGLVAGEEEEGVKAAD